MNGKDHPLGGKKQEPDEKQRESTEASTPADQASKQPPNIRPFKANAFISVVFFFAGAAAFYTASEFNRQEQSAIHQILTMITVGVGVVCWGFAWIGSMMGEKH